MIIKLDPIYTQGQATVSKRWVAVNFFNRIIFVNPNNDVLYYDGTNTRILGGLPLNELRWDGGVSFVNHVVLWKGNTLRWSDVNDAQNWIPVGATSGTGVVNTITNFTQPVVNSTVTVQVDGDPAGWVEGTFVRAIYTQNSVPLINYYTVVSVTEPTGKQVFTVNSSQTTTALTQRTIFTETAPSFGEGALIKVQGQTDNFTVRKESKKIGFVGVLAQPFTRPAVGSFVQITFSTAPVGLNSGDYISIAPDNSTPSRVGQDVYLVMGQANSNLIYNVQATNVGTDKKNHIAGDNVIYQPGIETAVFGPNVTITASSVLVDAHEVVLANENLSGAAQQGAIVPIGTQILPLTANEAGQYRGAGGEDRGPILACFQLGDLLYVCRRRGIQTASYVGRQEGIFTFRDEITDEGLLGKYLWVKVGYDETYLWGHRDMYKLSGTQLEPVARQVSKKMLQEEFDFDRLDEYIMYHNEADKEIWTVYRPKSEANPTKGNLKLMIYNYAEDSCVFDEWDEDIGGVTAIGGLNLADGSRSTMVGVSNNQITTANDKFLVHGKIDGNPIYSFLGRAIQSEAVTADLDFQDATAWKYIDTIRLDMYIKNPLPSRPFRLWVQFGGRNNLDSDVRWTNGQWVDVSGSGNIVTRVNLRASGRYITVKFLAEQADIQWRIASYTLSGRLGGTF
jgi:hypothetical protein